jgi:hypothetical protein
VHIDADGEIVIDLRAADDDELGGERLLVTTDLRCPNCGGTLRVDDYDRAILAAQLACIDCGFTYVQRLHRSGSPDRRALPHRKPRVDHPVDRRSPEEREQTIRAGADYFFRPG